MKLTELHDAVMAKRRPGEHYQLSQFEQGYNDGLTEAATLILAIRAKDAPATEISGADVMDDFGLTFGEEAKYRSLADQCEAGVVKFSNEQMSEALLLVETLRKRFLMVSPPPAAADVARRLAEIEARAKAATPGPWRNDHPSWMDVNDITVWCGPDGDDAMCVCNMGAPIADVDDKEQAKVSYANGEFVAHAREDIPYLLALARASTPATATAPADERARPTAEACPFTLEDVAHLCGQNHSPEFIRFALKCAEWGWDAALAAFRAHESAAATGKVAPASAAPEETGGAK